ncbi:MAG: hypothetical protein Q9193_006331 [Seirophora villosa]
MADPRWKDNHRFKIDYGLPRRRQEISKRAFKDKYTTLKNLVPEGIGGLNEGIRFVRDNLDGHRYVEKQFDPTSHVLLRELLLLHVLDHPNVIRYHDGFIDKTSWNHPTASLYMDFCNLKDAQRLIDKYHRRNARKPEAHHDYIPEAFIWHIFRSLACALQYIHFGIDVDDERSLEELDVAVRHEKYCQKVWPMIIHRDIKPGNIFFKKGLALPYNDPDWNDEQGIHGTCHWMAPELPKTYAQSDVWAVGAVILALCRQLPDGVLKPPPDDWTEGEEAWSMHPDARKGIRDRGVGEDYSVQLEFVVGECLHFSREKRPLAFKLLAMIDEGERGAREAGYLEEDMIPPFVWGGAQDTLHGRKPMPPGGKKVRFDDDI